MAPADFLASLIPDNAVARTELAYQQRSSRAPRRWWHRLGRALLFMTLTICLVLFGGGLTGLLFSYEDGPMDDGLRVITMIASAVVVIFHFVTLFRTLMLASNSLVRETQNKTWEMLVLTGIDSQQIARGKWSATVQHMAGQYVLLGVMSGCLTSWFGLYTIHDLVERFNRNSGGGTSHIFAPPMLDMLMGAVIVFVLTLANLPFTAACGVLASAQVRQNTMALMRAIGIRVLALLSVVIGTAMVFAVLRTGLADPVSVLVWRAITGLFFNGVLLGNQLSRVTYNFMGDDPPPNQLIYILPATLLSIGLYTVTTWLLLRMAQQGLVHEQALPPLRVAGSRFKLWSKGLLDG